MVIHGRVAMFGAWRCGHTTRLSAAKLKTPLISSLFCISTVFVTLFPRTAPNKGFDSVTRKVYNKKYKPYTYVPARLMNINYTTSNLFQLCY